VLARLAELRRKDVDPKTGMVRVRRAVIRPRTGPVVKEPKSEAGRRDVFMPDWMLDDLRGHLDRFTGPGKDDLLFPNYLGEPLSLLGTGSLGGASEGGRRVGGTFHDRVGRSPSGRGCFPTPFRCDWAILTGSGAWKCAHTVPGLSVYEWSSIAHSRHPLVESRRSSVSCGIVGCGEACPKRGPDDPSVRPFVCNGAMTHVYAQPPCLALSHSYRDRMRVYELARELAVPSREVIARLRADGEWVASHLSLVPEPVVTRCLSERPGPPKPTPPEPAAPIGDRPSQPQLSHLAAEILSAPKRRYRHRTGPRPSTMLRWTGDDYDDPLENLRNADEITTRDVADLLGVTQAAVRRWVARRYISPVGRFGLSNVFRANEVLAAYEQIAARRKATGKPRRSRGWFVEPRPVDRIRPKHYDAVINVGEAARLLGISPATIRSWMHRGHLLPLASSKPRDIRLRLGDVINAARARRLPERRIRP
jgi:DNA-binding transcriptional MerR regulator